MLCLSSIPRNLGYSKECNIAILEDSGEGQTITDKVALAIAPINKALKFALNYRNTIIQRPQIGLKLVRKMKLICILTKTKNTNKA